MKKLLVILISVGFIHNANAQTIKAGIEGAFNSTWLFNKNVSDAGDQLDYKSTFAPQFGVSGVFTSEEGAGVYLGIMSGSVNQKYTTRTLAGTPFEKSFETETKLKYIDIPVLFRLTTKGGFYFEVGPQFSLLSNAKFVGNNSTTDIKSETNSLNISGQIGLGMDVKASDKISIIAGLRFGYGFTDAAKKGNEVNYKPTHSAVGGLHVGVAYTISSK